MLAVHSVEIYDGIMEQMQQVMQQMQQDRVAMLQQMQVMQETITNFQTGGGPPGLHQRRGRLDTKGMKMLPFAGVPEEWDDWSFSFKLGLGAQDPKVQAMLTKLETQEEQVDELGLEDDMAERSRQIYAILGQMLVGEPLAMVKQFRADSEGFRSFQVLHKKYNPKTRVRMIRFVGEITRPPVVSELRDVEAMIIKWEDKVKTLRVQYTQTLTEEVRLGIMQKMPPMSVQDYMTTNLDNETDYDAIREKIRLFCMNKMDSPMAMDCSEVNRQEYIDGNYEEEYQGWDDAQGHAQNGDASVGIEAVWPGTKCHNCGGDGHMSRTCSSPPKGKGKGGKGKDSKGDGKGGKGWYGKGHGAPQQQLQFNGQYNGGGKKGDSKGGVKGACWRCGKIGHRAYECKSGVNEVLTTETVDQEKQEVPRQPGDTGGVWVLAQGVEVQRRCCEVINSSIGNKGAKRMAAAPKKKDSTVTTYSNSGLRGVVTNHKALEKNSIVTNLINKIEAKTKIGDQGAERKVKDLEKNSTVTTDLIDLDDFGLGDIWPNVVEKRKKRKKTKNVMIAAVLANGKEIKIGNRFAALDEDDIEILEVEGSGLTSEATMKFNVSNAKRALASASRVVAAGNRIVMDSREGHSYIENSKTEEKMMLRVLNGVYVFDVTYKDGTEGVVTLDSGAGVHVMPKGLQPEVKLGPKNEGLRMSAANGSVMENLGTKVLKFKGRKPTFSRQA